MFAGLVGGVGRLAEVLTASIAAAGAAVVLDATVRELVRLPAGWRLVTGSAASPKTIERGRRGAGNTRDAGWAAAGRNGTMGRARSRRDRLREHGGRHAGILGRRPLENPLAGSGFLVPVSRRQADQGCDVLDRQKWGWYDDVRRRAGALLDRASWRRRRPAAVRRRAGGGRCARSRGGGRRPRACRATASSPAGAVRCRSTASATSTG